MRRGIALDRVAESFAAAAADPSRWNEAMDVAARATGSFGAIMVPVKGRLPDFPVSGSMTPTVEAYVGKGWIHRDERYRGLPQFLARGVSTELDFTTADEIARNPFYQEFLAKFGLRWFAGVKVSAGDDVWGLSIQRSIAQGTFAPHELAELAALSQHLAGAAALARAFGFARIDAALQAFEMSRSAVGMFDRGGEVLRLNANAERLLDGDLSVVQRKLVSFDRNATVVFERALHDLIWSPEPLALLPPVLFPRKQGRPILAYLSRPSARIREGLGLCQAIVVFVDLDVRPVPLKADLAQAFALTPGEARLAVELASGESIESTAEKLGITYETARNVLKRLFEKTDTHRQTQLVTLLTRFALRPKDPGPDKK